jgi:hypothetical protein
MSSEIKLPWLKKAKVNELPREGCFTTPSSINALCQLKCNLMNKKVQTD